LESPRKGYLGQNEDLNASTTAYDNLNIGRYNA
jgi:hypothetical protein